MRTHAEMNAAEVALMRLAIDNAPPVRELTSAQWTTLQEMIVAGELTITTHDNREPTLWIGTSLAELIRAGWIDRRSV